jgi:4-amino-4-deoxy-L-arabinose transferase-like glycosyltransferase
MVLGLALVVRFAHLAQVGQTPLMSYHRVFVDSDMYLFDQWARRIADGDVLGREVYQPLAQWQLQAAPQSDWDRWYGRGPVFYKAPFYPYLIALLYRVFGDAMPALALLQIVASTLCVLLIVRIGREFFGHAAGLVAGAIYAVYAPGIHYDVIMLRGPWISLVALVGTWQLISFLRVPSLHRALVVGLVLGASLVVNEGFVTVVPLALLVLLFRRPAGRCTFTSMTMLLVGMMISLSPVAVRNLLVGVWPLKLAVTGSVAYATCNTAGSSPYFFTVDPEAYVPAMRAGDGRLLATAVACLRSFRGPTEVAAFYLHKAAGLAIPFESPDNANFYYAALHDPLLRLLPNYTLVFPLSVIGLTLGLRQWKQLLPSVPFPLSLGLLMVVALPISRYRTTLVVYLVSFAGLALVRVAAWLTERRVVPLTAATAAFVLLLTCAAAWQDWVVFKGRPAGIFLYRAPEFLLGADYYWRRRREAEAIQELTTLARVNPDRSARAWAALSLASLQLAAGRQAHARQALGVAAETSAGSPTLLMAIGDFHRDALQDAREARLFYEKALAVVPPSNLERQLRQRLATIQPP